MRDRTVCSLRGFFQLALELRESGKVTDLIANLPPLFWQNLKSILRQLFQNHRETQSNSFDSRLSEVEQKIVSLKTTLQNVLIKIDS